MANKGLPLELEYVDKMWVQAYKPLTNEKITIVQLSDRNGFSIRTMRMVYSRNGIAITVGIRVPPQIGEKWFNAENWARSDYEVMLKEAFSTPIIYIPGPTKAYITKVSNKHGNIRLVGREGDVTIWQRAGKKKNHRFVGNEWGIEIRMEDQFFVRRGTPGRVIKLDRLIDAYNRLGEMFKIL